MLGVGLRLGGSAGRRQKPILIGVGHSKPRAPGHESSPVLRAQRAKLKSRRDVMIIAQGKRGTSAALGYTTKEDPSPYSCLALPARQPAGPNRNKGSLVWRGRYPGRRPRRPCPGLLSRCPFGAPEVPPKLAGRDACATTIALPVKPRLRVPHPGGGRLTRGASRPR